MHVPIECPIPVEPTETSPRLRRIVPGHVRTFAVPSNIGAGCCIRPRYEVTALQWNWASARVFVAPRRQLKTDSTCNTRSLK